MPLRTVELFSGTASFSRVAAARGHSTFTVDNDPRHKPDLIADVMDLSAADLPHADIIWASPDCRCFSKAACSRNWVRKNGIAYPQRPEAEQAAEMVIHTLKLIRDMHPAYWFIENPVGFLRTMNFMRGVGKRRTVTYCQYGHSVQKPTDIWTNCYHWKPRPMCKAGDPCHVNSPRGKNLGVRNLGGATVRSIVPAKLCEEIIMACEESLRVIA